MKIDWIASYPKSGNTWIRLLLNHYRYGYLPIDERDNLTTLDTEKYAAQIVAPLPLNEMTPGEKFYLRNAALLHIMSRYRKYCIVKTHCADLPIQGMPLIPPGMTRSRIYIVRDPRDVCISKANHMDTDIDKAISLMNEKGYGLNPEDGAPALVSTWSVHAMSWLATADLVIKYEDMIADTASVLIKVLDVLGWDMDEDRVNKAVDACDFKELQLQEKETGFQEASGDKQFFKTGRSGYWKDILTTEQADKVVEDHREVMEQLGYV